MALYKIAVLIQDDRYYRGIETFIKIRGIALPAVIRLSNTLLYAFGLIQAFIKIYHFAIARLAAVVIELHGINK
jgi:hypothetical protein